MKNKFKRTEKTKTFEKTNCRTSMMYKEQRKLAQRQETAKINSEVLLCNG